MNDQIHLLTLGGVQDVLEISKEIRSSAQTIGSATHWLIKTKVRIGKEENLHMVIIRHVSKVRQLTKPEGEGQFGAWYVRCWSDDLRWDRRRSCLRLL